MPDSFQNPIGGRPRDSFEKARIEEIQKDKEKDEKSFKSLSARHSLFTALIIVLFKKFLDLFGKTEQKSLIFSAESNLRQTISDLKDSLKLLQTEDLSQNALYLNQLSDLWLKLLENALLFRKSSPLNEQIQSLIRSIQHYPEGQDHSLGYYLSEYAGQKWLPFPYMKMIRQLQEEYQRNPTQSHLHQWIIELAQMIHFLQNKNS